MSAEDYVRQLQGENQRRLSRLAPDDTLKPEVEGNLNVLNLLKVALRNEIEATEIAARWLVTTDDVDVKLALARQVGDEAKHYRMIADRGVFIVADGMGGHAAGEVASEMAVRYVARELDSLRGLSDKQIQDRMTNAIRTANGAIFQRTLTEHDKRGMGTTVTALTLYENRFLIGQVGDSRGYLLRDSKLTQITKDHSYVQEQVDAGYLTPEQARTHPYSNVITRCVGANSDVTPDLYGGVVKPGDLYLLASDGLTGMLEDYQLAELLAPDRMPQDEVDSLIAEANRHGGLDNITAIIVRIDSVEAPTQDNVTTQQTPARPR